MLQELGKGHKVAIFVLDEFDLFAKKAKQTTLYNLLDAMQSAGMQVNSMLATGFSYNGDLSCFQLQ